MGQEVDVWEFGDEKLMDSLGFFTDIADGDLGWSQDDKKIVGNEFSINNLMFEVGLGDEEPFIGILGVDAFVVEKGVVDWEDEK